MPGSRSGSEGATKSKAGEPGERLGGVLGAGDRFMAMEILRDTAQNFRPRLGLMRSPD
jgi:hypothetical protein